MTDVNLKAKITLQDDASKPLAEIKTQLMGLAQGGVGAAMAGKYESTAGEWREILRNDRCQ